MSDIFFCSPSLLLFTEFVHGAIIIQNGMAWHCNSLGVFLTLVALCIQNQQVVMSFHIVAIRSCVNSRRPITRLVTSNRTRKASLKSLTPNNIICRHATSGSDTASSDSKRSSEKLPVTDVPIVFLHGMKGSHLAYEIPDTKEKKRSWLTLSALLNLPVLGMGNPTARSKTATPVSPSQSSTLQHGLHPERDISLPLTYSECKKFQDRGVHTVDGIVEHIVDLTKIIGVFQSKSSSTDTKNNGGLGLFPFYGHATQHLKEINDLYDNHLVDPTLLEPHNGEERKLHCRPTRSFSYDWRRNLFELVDEFHNYCEKEFPNQQVQVVAHSLGGLITFGAMRKHPEKYRPGAVLVGVPFGTGIQYLQDMHKGYFTELGTCRQFLPASQFTFSSHWSFFPLDKDELADTFVDVTDQPNIPFLPDQSTIGKKPGVEFKDTVPGQPIDIDFYNPDSWENHQIGIFDPYYRHNFSNDDIAMYKEHMNIQLEMARSWRTDVLRAGDPTKDDMPPLHIMSTNTIPTTNQILRRKRRQEDINDSKNNDEVLDTVCPWEYDYMSGRSVPGDGRIDYDKSFPPKGVPYKSTPLDSLHAKQFCWEESGGSLGKIWEQVSEQLEQHLKQQQQQQQGEEEREVAMQVAEK